MKRITAPDAEPVTAAEILTKIGVQAGDIEPADLDMLIASARTWAEDYTGRAFITQTWETRLDDFPAKIELKAPAASVVSVKYIAPDGTETTVASTEYVLDDYSQPGFIHPAYDKSWPVARCEKNAVRVQFTCGYGAAGAAVPEPIRQAIVLIVGQNLRGQSGMEANLYPSMIPNAARQLLDPYRVMRF